MPAPARALPHGMDYNLPRIYEELVAPRYAPIASELVQAAGLASGEIVLELGAGTGLVTRQTVPWLEPGGLLVAADRSTAMLEVARSTVESGRVLFVTLDHAEPLPFLSASFDVVLSGLTYVQDALEPVREVARVLRPGGRVALSMWAEDYLELRLMCEAKRRLGLDPVPRPDPAAVLQRLADAGFNDVQRRTLELGPRFACVEDYLAYRRGFGVPVGSTPEEHERFLQALGAEAARLTDHDGSFTQNWVFCLITAVAAP